MKKTAAPATAGLRRCRRLAEALPFAGVAGLGGRLAQPPGESLVAAEALAALAVFLLAAFAFLYNDWQDRRLDARHPEKRSLSSAAWFSSPARAGLVLALLALSALTLAWLCGGLATLALAAVSLLLGWWYSWRRFPAKQLPVASSIVHLVEADLAFVLGWWAVAGPGWEAWWPGLSFGLVFAAGHLHHEARDVTADRQGSVKTHAVRYGTQATLLAACLLWLLSAGPLTHWALSSASGAELVGWVNLAAVGCYLLAFCRVWLRGFKTADLAGLRLFYRGIYALAGLVMLASRLPGVGKP